MKEELIKAVGHLPFMPNENLLAGIEKTIQRNVRAEGEKARLAAEKRQLAYELSPPRLIQTALQLCVAGKSRRGRPPKDPSSGGTLATEVSPEQAGAESAPPASEPSGGDSVPPVVPKGEPGE